MNAMTSEDAGLLLPHERLHRALLDDARPAAVAAQRERGKWTARQRIAYLTDEETFDEVGALALGQAPGANGGALLADGLVTGLAEVDGRPVVVMASDFTVAGGSNGLVGNEKQRRCWELAAARGIPIVMLWDGGGHRIQEGLDAATFAGGFDIQQAQAQLSGWVPMVAAILGPAYGQPTLAAALCDYVVAVRGIAFVGMGPPALVAAATGEQLDVEQACGADAQAGFGTVDLAVDTEEEALDALRWYLAMLPRNAEADLPVEPPVPPCEVSRRALDTAVPSNLRSAYDMYDVIAGIVDEDSGVEIKAGYAPNLITTLARLEGRPLGVLANQPAVKAGMLDVGGAAKAAHLVSLCDAYGIPLLILMDLPGLAVGHEAESGGLARYSARLILELGAASVPTFTVIARKGYGGGYVVMSGGRTFHPDMVIAWPDAEMAVMGAEAAVHLMYRREVAASADPERHRANLISSLKGTVGAVRAAEAFGIDAVIRPSQTRDRLARAMRDLPRRRLSQTLNPRRHAVGTL